MAGKSRKRIPSKLNTAEEWREGAKLTSLWGWGCADSWKLTPPRPLPPHTPPPSLLPCRNPNPNRDSRASKRARARETEQVVSNLELPPPRRNSCKKWGGRSRVHVLCCAVGGSSRVEGHRSPSQSHSGHSTGHRLYCDRILCGANKVGPCA